MALEEMRIEGYVGENPKYGSGKGAEMLNFPVGVTQSIKNKNTNMWENKTNWYQIEIWDKQRSEFYYSRIKKGDKVVVEGRLIVKPYMDKEGKPKNNVTIIAKTIVYINKSEAQQSTMQVLAKESVFDEDYIPF